MGNHGYTLLEVMFVAAILTIVSGSMFMVSLSFADSVDVQDMRANSSDEVRRVFMELVPELRQAQRQSINWSDLPGTSITFRVPEDLDGNGTAVNKGGLIELGTPITVELDLDDRNNDGITATQLVRIQEDDVTVLANALAQTGPDDAAAGQEVQGILFAPWGAGVQFVLTTEGRDRAQRAYRSSVSQVVMPRN